MLDRAKELKDPNLANYKTAMAASTVCAISTLISSSEGCSFSFYANLVATLSTAGLAANQYAWQHHPEFAARTTNMANSYYALAAAKCSSLFAQKGVTAKPETPDTAPDAECTNPVRP